jgi:anti-sigma B factor antagonist
MIESSYRSEKRDFNFMAAQATTRQTASGVTVVEIEGRLALGNRLMELEWQLKQLIDGGARKIVFDLSRLDHIASAGVGMLMLCSGLVEQAQGRLFIAGAKGIPKRVFDVVHLDRAIPCVSDVANAEQQLAS